MDVSENGGTPKSSNFNRVFHYKPSILGYPYFWKHPDLFFKLLNILLSLEGTLPKHRNSVTKHLTIEVIASAGRAGLPGGSLVKRWEGLTGRREWWSRDVKVITCILDST